MANEPLDVDSHVLRLAASADTIVSVADVKRACAAWPPATVDRALRSSTRVEFVSAHQPGCPPSLPPVDALAAVEADGDLYNFLRYR